MWVGKWREIKRECGRRCDCWESSILSSSHSPAQDLWENMFSQPCFVSLFFFFLQWSLAVLLWGFMQDVRCMTSPCSNNLSSHYVNCWVMHSYWQLSVCDWRCWWYSWRLTIKTKWSNWCIYHAIPLVCLFLVQPSFSCSPDMADRRTVST